MNNLKIYIKSILIPVIVGGIIGLIINPFINYGSLNKPPLAPPGILFSIIWPILYVLMGFIWILVLDVIVIYMIVLFYKKNKVAGILQVPYLLWILFASYLNIAIYVLN